MILTENFLGNIKTQIVFILTENFSDNILKFVVLSDEQPKSKKLPNFYFAKIRTYTSTLVDHTTKNLLDYLIDEKWKCY